jgi:hypothetical protein
MSIYETIQARIRADQAADERHPCDETIEGARAEIVGDILEIAEKWRLKAEDWGPEETFVALREIVCQQVLDALNEGLYDDEATP